MKKETPTLFQPIDEQMLKALELFYYSSRFQRRMFLISLEPEIQIENILIDLRVLHAAQIKISVICQDTKGLESKLDQLKERGYPVMYCKFQLYDKPTKEEEAKLNTAIQTDHIPIIGIPLPPDKKPQLAALDEYTLNLASFFIVNKIFFLSNHEGLMINGNLVSHLTNKEGSDYLAQRSDINIGPERLSFLIKENQKNGAEIVLLQGKSGCLYQEIFTHYGKGTLITNHYPNVFRKGELSDVKDVSLMIKPYVQSGAILPMSEDQIAQEITDFYMYTVNQAVVAIAKLTEYGPAVELAKVCTLPHYQGKGRARELALNLINKAKEINKSYIFSLSIEPKMFDFFENLGFVEIDRDELPDNWKANYDMRRKSKAFRLMLK